jgi:Domain of unknown function (DUF6883)
MALPFLDRAQIAPAKIRDYLLNPEHAVGRAKARFVAGLGFTWGHWADLHAALLAHAALGETQALLPTAFGQKYLVRGGIEGPVEFVTASGRTQALVTLGTADVRPVSDYDLLAVRPTPSKVGAA